MLVRDVYLDLAVHRRALARMDEIDRLLLAPEADVDALMAERAALDGSWFGERWIEVADVLTEGEALERDRLAAAAQSVATSNAEIQAQLAANDVKAIRAMLEGDSTRLAAHAKQQADLRAKLR